MPVLTELGPRLIRTLLLPPAAFWVLAACGWLVRRRRKRLGRGLIAAGLALLYLSSTPLVAALLLRALETDPLLAPGATAGAEAIVVLGGDLDGHAPEFGGTTLGPLSLDRARYAALLARRTGLPVLVTGGPLWPGGVPVARIVTRYLVEEAQVPVQWVEDRSVDTWDNAARTAATLAGSGIGRVVLVTQAWHMRRARIAFAAAGLAVVPAPTGMTGWPDLDPLMLLPSGKATERSFFAMHEWLGTIVYEVRRSLAAHPASSPS